MQTAKKLGLLLMMMKKNKIIEFKKGAFYESKRK